MEDAIEFIRSFYSYLHLTREDVINHYWNEVEEYMKLKIMWDDYKKNNNIL